MTLNQLNFFVSAPFFRYILLHFASSCFTLTYSMEQSSSWEANWFCSQSRNSPHFWNPKVHHGTHKCPPSVPILSQLHPVLTTPSHLLKIHLNIILLSQLLYTGLLIHYTKSFLKTWKKLWHGTNRKAATFESNFLSFSWRYEMNKNFRFKKSLFSVFKFYTHIILIKVYYKCISWGSVGVKALRYKSDGSGIDSRCRRDFPVASDSSMCPGADSVSKSEYQDIPGGKGGQCVRLTTYHLHVPTVKKSGGLNLLEPIGSVQACNGTALPFTERNGCFGFK